MQRWKHWASLLGLFCFLFHPTKNMGACKGPIKPAKCSKNPRICEKLPGPEKAERCFERLSEFLKKNPHCDKLQAIRQMEEVLEETEVTETRWIHSNCSVAVLYKPAGSGCKGLEMDVSDSEVGDMLMLGAADKDVPRRKARFQLPEEVKLGPDNIVAFMMIQLPDEVVWEGLENLYDHRLIALSVRGTEVSGLKEPIKITLSITTSIKEHLEPMCVYLNTSTNDTTPEKCDDTTSNQTHITCFSNHLTYFGVLLVSAEISAKDEEILFYMTYIGCSISLLALLITVVLCIIKRKLRGDDSKKIHISLAVALILLNVHFLPSQAVAAMPSSELCLYVALLLHYSLLASFTWMALEGFHLYLLLVKVFNIYVRRYLLKLSVVGWGLPAVVVSVVVMVDKSMYGRTPLIASRPNETTICYITNNTAKTVTTVGLLSLVFIFNLIMFGVTVKWFMRSRFNKE
ncbi:adhesion G-protein coupled receptor G1-like, partial [Cyprinodon tularosa]|uniref:adhesion G-protein coupled receptor G1-like n=1 Tax=Cyprinodon tularosa TaxID=77115 RepID=UPI0018E213F9